MLLEPWTLGAREARNRVVFGPHVTNLGDGRALSRRHVAYYARRAAGGAGVIVTETASVHESDWPYERAPLASRCASGWAEIAEACTARGALTIASIGHCGLQGSTAYSQDVLWAPSIVPNVLTHEMPLALGDVEIDQLRRSTVQAARVAIDAGCDGVELNVGQFSLFRQFMSALTNHRNDRWAEPTALVEVVLKDLRAAVGDGVLGVRFCADELAPWAGITPAMAGEYAVAIASCGPDYLTIERGSIFSEAATRPDMQVEPGFNRELVAIVRSAIDERVAVVAQGSVVEVAMAESLLATHCDAVEMTRAQIADPDLARKALSGDVATIRPCVLCNQGCQVRDVRNPIVSCTVNPTAGHEFADPFLDDERPSTELAGRSVSIIGAGPAGLEAARRAALRGASVKVRERRHRIGGSLLEASQLPGRSSWQRLIAWYEGELARLGVDIEVSTPVTPFDESGIDLAATGRSIGRSSLRDGDDGTVPVVPAATVLADDARFERVVVIDPVGAVVGVGVAELLARRGCAVSLVTPDLVAGTQLSLTGDLVAANTRLAVAGVRLITHAAAVAIEAGAVVVEDRYDGERITVAADLVVDAGFDEPAQPQWGAAVIGDALAPRTVLSAVLEGRRFASRLANEGAR